MALTYYFKSGSNLEKAGKLKTSKMKEDNDSDEPEPRLKNSVSNIKNLSCVKTVRNLFPYVLIVLSVKLSYFFDREKSLNFPLHPKLEELRNVAQSNQSLKNALGYLGVLGLVMIENLYINPKYRLNRTFASKYLSNLISGAILFSHYL